MYIDMADNYNTNSTFTAEEEARIQAEVEAYQQKVREAEIEAAARNRILDEEHKQPGKRYY